MKGKIIILVSLLVISVIIAGNSIADESDVTPEGEYYGEAAPAPNSGNGVSDGSGFVDPIGLDGGSGPAPNSGDGVPDGSGF
jgi:hypothetical protein